MSWDVDGNGQLDPLTDGRLVLLYLLGLQDRTLIENSVATDATRTTFAQIIDYLDGIREELDIDGNGEIDALTDGVLNYRRQLGVIDEDLIRNAIGAGATRSTAAAVTAYLESQKEPIPIETGSTLETATDVALASTDTTYTSQVGGENPSGYLEFSVGATNEFNLSISDLSADANVQIIDIQSGEVILSSTNAGIADESISGQLETGTYGIRIFSADGASTDYNLEVSVTPQLSGITTGASDAPIQITTDVSSPVINLDDFRPDPRFTGVDGSGFATVIMDTGINLDHPFFGPDEDSDGIADRIVYHYDFADNDLDASDVNGHGSNVSSIVASSDSTFTGIAPGADIIHLKVFTDAGGGNFGYVEQALQWVLENVDTYNIASVNMSIGDSQNWNTAISGYGLGDELAALAAQNVIVVSSSGNNYFRYQSPGVGYPAADPNSLSIGAVYDSNVGRSPFLEAEAFTTGTDRITAFSQRHPTLTTVFAPGAFITGAAADSNGTRTQGGTSQAAPHVAGMAVLAQQLAVQELGRRLTPSEFSDLLVSTGVTINDGDDEDDDVTNTGLDFKRADMFALAEGILSLAPNQPPVATNDSATVDFQTSAIIAVLANDTDANGDRLSISGFSLTSQLGGAIAQEGDALRYTPANGFSGNDSFRYSISDGNGGTDSATVNVTVLSAPNQPPVAANDSATVDFQTSAIIAVLANDTDENGDNLSISGFSLTSELSGAIAREGDALRYTPANGFSGNDSFQYSISDGNGGTDSATVNVTVSPAPNQPPVAVNDSASITAGTTATINAIANDNDPDGDALNITGVSNPLNGNANIINGNQLIYIPGQSPSGNPFTGRETFTYTISDGRGGVDSATISVTVNPPPNSDPVAVNDAVTVNGGGTANIAVLANDSDSDGDDLSISGFASTSASGGTISQNGDSLTYRPPANFSGSNDSFIYSISDGRGGTDSATVNVTILNSPPVANNDAATTSFETNATLAVLTNDSDPNGDSISISGLASVSANGGTISQSGNQLVYSPPAGFSGNDSFTYSIADVRGAIASATVNLTVSQAPNNVPVAVNDSATVNSGETVNIPVSINDSDPDGDILSISGFASTSANGGTIGQNGNQLAYTPSASFTGNDSFIYSISDGRGGTDSATVNVTVVNESPVANNDSATVNSGETATLAVLANDSDPDGDNLSISGFSSRSATGAIISQSGNQLVYSRDANFSGNDSFSYSISDGRGGTDSATVNITVLNRAPVAVNDATTVNAGTTATIAVLANDSDPDGDNLSISGLASQSAAGGTISLNGTQLQYSPPASFSGNDSFSYSISDGKGGTDSATVNVTVINQSPIAVNDATTVNAGETATVAVLANDSDPDGDNLSISGFSSQSANGGTISQAGTQLQYSPPASFSGNDSFSYSISDGNGGADVATVNVTVLNRSPVANNDAAIANLGETVNISVLTNDSDPDGDNLSLSGFASRSAIGGTISQGGSQLQYTPPAGFRGNDSFNYSISDGKGGTDVATVTINVLNRGPVANNDVVTLPPASTGTIDVLANDTDPDGDALQITTVNSPSNGTVVISNNQAVYSPAAGFIGNDSFSYAIVDGNGGLDSATVNVTVGGNQPPVAINDAVSTIAGGTTTIAALLNDSDPDPNTNLSITGVSIPTNGGTVFRSDNGTPTNPIDDRIVYISPNATFTGTDSFTYSITDQQGGFDSATVSVTVNGNQAPTANNDAFTVAVASTSTLDVLENDSDPNVGDTLRIIGAANNSSLGSVTFTSDRVIYTPNAGLNTNFFGSDSFTYTIADVVGMTATATGVVTLGGIQPPDAIRDTAGTSTGIATTIDVLANDTDPAGALTVSSFGNGSNGTVTRDTNGTSAQTDDKLIYTPNATFIGTDSFTYTVTGSNTLSDGSPLTDSAVVTVIVSANQPPVANPDNVTIQLGTTSTINVLDNDFDPNGGALSVVSAGGNNASLGTVSVTNGQVFYTPNSGLNDPFVATDSFIYSIQDVAGAVDTAVVTVTLGGNQPPTAVNDTVIAIQTIPTTIDVLANDIDPDNNPNGGTLSITGVGTAANGTVNIDRNGTDSDPSDDKVIYTSTNPAFTGTDSFVYSITDSDGTSGATVSATVNVIVNQNGAPIANADNVTVLATGASAIDVLANDIDPNPGDTLSVIGVGNQSNTAAGTVVVTNGQVIYTSAGTGTDFTGTDSFTYTISDISGNTSTASVSVTVGGPQPPIANADSIALTQGSTATLSAGLTSNDSDPNGDVFSIVGVSPTTSGGGTASVVGGQVIYNAPTVVGTDTFTYSISDADGTSSASVTVTLNPSNAPIAVNDTTTIQQGNPATIAVLANDSDPDGDSLQLVATSQPINGTAAIGGNNAIYIPNSGFAGLDFFTYSVTDGLGGTASATVTVQVGGSQPPDAVNDTFTAVQAITNTLSVLANDSDPDGGTLAITGVSTAANGTVTVANNEVLYSSNSTTFTGIDSFTYTIADGQGNIDSATVNLIVEANQGPTAVNDSFTLSTATTLAVLDNDTDPNPGDRISIIGVGSQTNAANAGTVALTNGNVIYSPIASAATGVTSTIDSFIYTISDISGNTSTASVSVTVGGPVPPVANNDSVTVTQNTTTTLAAGLTSNDSDPNADVFTIVGVTNPTNGGTANVTGGQVIYNAPNSAGTDTFTYSISDGTGTDSASVTVSVIAGSATPVANNDYAIAITSQSVTIPVLESDADPNGDTLSITGVSTPVIGTASIFDNGTTISSDDQIIYTGAIAGATDTFTYSITDSNGGTDAATVTVSVFNDAAGISRGITGDANNNVLVGSNGTAVIEELNGGSGNDILIGRGGGDQLLGNAGADEFRFLANTDSVLTLSDTITDFNPGENDTIRLAFLSTSTGISITNVVSNIFNLTVSGTSFSLNIATDSGITQAQIESAIQLGLG